MNEEYKDLKIVDVINGYFMFKRLLDNNLIVKEEDGYTINIDFINIYLKKQLLNLQKENTEFKQQLKEKDEKISEAIDYIKENKDKAKQNKYDGSFDSYELLDNIDIEKLLDILESE